MADGKITIELSVDSKGAASDISRIESQLKGLPKGEVTVSANVKDAQSAIDEFRNAAEAVPDRQASEMSGKAAEDCARTFRHKQQRRSLSRSALYEWWSIGDSNP